ncbi:MULTISPECIES: hypothetical protein [Sphingomonadaceae]|jgi:hypothetical protein|uniref:Uncharacterized protein n=3 Tax=Sphingomonadaceae TaxID=41297 RepID=F6ETF9_SPHCR|nr:MULTISPECIES: hypothetical protein [Sphingomonadaceae]AEG48619.1 hypothetical protein Sphch_0928 [Sphingobium chlorophenolicum L-1]AMK18167.1 hypothetical protein K663_08930 [Sphingobium sp. MI1205]KEQ55529.1 hypothetical protein BV95_00168 [Sphingobium chlorophenolicum]RIA46515.1 hypothetical protein DFR49_1057 [Hephaestia caeni]UZW56046.1 hypothetical protein NUH86_04440 [Sphingobium sp. JS3065]
MIEMHLALSALRRVALVSTQSELDAARMEAADILDQAGWEKSARIVIDSIGRPVASDDQEGPSRQG